jgi:hypothetical protein
LKTAQPPGSQASATTPAARTGRLNNSSLSNFFSPKPLRLGLSEEWMLGINPR